MRRVSLIIILIFAVPLAIAYFFQYLKDFWRKHKRLQDEWRDPER